MPPIEAGIAHADEVYAVTAFVLFRNGIIKETDVLDATSLPKVRMPNRDNFLPVDPGKPDGETAVRLLPLSRARLGHKRPKTARGMLRGGLKAWSCCLSHGSGVISRAGTPSKDS